MTGLLVLTDRRQARLPLVQLIECAVAGGARAVLLREKDLPRAQRLRLAQRLREILEPVGGRLIVAGTDPLGGDAVHLAAADPPDRPDVPWAGRSCHSAEELAGSSTMDYATLSPVFPTASKPGYGPALGTQRFGRLAAGTHLRVFALGGIASVEQARECVRAGAAGVAVMGAVMRATDPAAVIRGFRAAAERVVP